MRTAKEIANQYFDLSNQSDIDSIRELFTESTTYSSQNTGIYLGADAVCSIQSVFHDSFNELHWAVNSCEEVKPGIILFDYTFTGFKKTGEQVTSNGLEYIVVQNEKIIHIGIRNK